MPIELMNGGFDVHTRRSREVSGESRGELDDVDSRLPLRFAAGRVR